MGFLSSMGDIFGEIAKESINQFASSFQEELRKQEEEENRLAIAVTEEARDVLKEIYDSLEEVKIEACKTGNIEDLLIPSVRIAVFLQNDLEMFCNVFSANEEEENEFEEVSQKVISVVELLDTMFSDLEGASEEEIEKYTEIKLKNTCEAFYRKIKLLYKNVNYFSEQEIMQKNVETVTAFTSILFQEISNVNTFLLDSYDEMLDTFF